MSHGCTHGSRRAKDAKSGFSLSSLRPIGLRSLDDKQKKKNSSIQINKIRPSVCNNKLLHIIYECIHGTQQNYYF